METAIFLVGAGISWGIAHFYYRRSNTVAPDWAKPLIEKLPDAPITIERLIDLYHEAIETGQVTAHPSGYVKCPECGVGQEHFKGWEAVDHEREDHYWGFKCDKCNHVLSENVE